MAISIEKAVPSDAALILEYLKQVGGESDNLLHGENEFIVPIEGVKRKLVMSKESENSIVLIALKNEQIIARAELEGYYKARIRHRAKFSISVKKEYWNQGIGTRMFRELIRIAEENPNLIQMELEFVEGNSRARALYEKMGFRITGMKPNAIRLKDGTLLNESTMIREIKR